MPPSTARACRWSRPADRRQQVQDGGGDLLGLHQPTGRLAGLERGPLGGRVLGLARRRPIQGVSVVPGLTQFDADALVEVVGGHRQRERQHGPLAGAVEGPFRQPGRRGDGAHVHHRGPVGASQVRQRGPGGTDHAEHVDVEDPAPLVDRVGLDRALGADARVVHQGVDAAERRRRRRRRGPRTRRRSRRRRRDEPRSGRWLDRDRGPPPTPRGRGLRSRWRGRCPIRRRSPPRVARRGRDLASGARRGFAQAGEPAANCFMSRPRRGWSGGLPAARTASRPGRGVRARRGPPRSTSSVWSRWAAGQLGAGEAGRVHHDPGPRLDAGLHLHLPLVGDRRAARASIARSSASGERLRRPAPRGTTRGPGSRRGTPRRR